MYFSIISYNNYKFLEDLNMAYKFQLGAAKLGGKVTAAGLDAGDADIDNVADIAVASISADGSDITVVATDNREAAFQVSSSAAGPILFVDTSTGTESAFAPKGLAVDMDGEVKVRSNSGRMELHVSGAFRCWCKTSYC
jgi:hypothetical protein